MNENSLIMSFVSYLLGKSSSYKRKYNMDRKNKGNEDDAEAPPFFHDKESHMKNKKNEVVYDDGGTAQENQLPFLRAMYLLVQGLLGGFAFVSLYQQVAAPTDEDFLRNYQQVAAEHRRFFLILTSASLVGSLHISMSIYGTIFSNNRGSKTSSIDMDGQILMAPFAASNVVMHLLCFLVNLAMATFDTLVAHENGYDESSSSTTNVSSSSSTNEYEWITSALDDSTFTNAFNSWKNLERVRLGSALIAWLGCCLLSWFLHRSAFTLHAKTNIQKSNFQKWKVFAKEMEGDPLALEKYRNMSDKMYARHLILKLVDIQENGLHRTRVLLDELSAHI